MTILYRPLALAFAALLILNMPVPVSSADAPYGGLPSGPGGAGGAMSRIKDLANFEGVRQNQLIGYGLVVGLNGTGDTLNNSRSRKQSLTAMLERLGVNIRGQTLRTNNVAAVMVTANLPPFGTQGTRDRRHGLGAGRRQEPARRHAACHPAARRRRQRLCGGAGLGGDRRLLSRR